MEEKKFVGIDEAAKAKNISPYLLRKGIKEGRFPAIQVTKGGKYLIDLQLLTQVLDGEALSGVQTRPVTD